jgi:hypothetical protein
MEPPSYIRSVVDRNVVMRRIPLFNDATPRTVSTTSYVGHKLGKSVYMLRSASIFRVKGKVVPVHVIKACRGRAGISPLIPNFGIR